MMKNVYFISDLHLGASYIADPREHEGRVVRFLESIAGDAEELYLLGDILDYWYEYRHVVPRGHVRFLGALARLADAGVKITWLTGNHDVWLFDYIRDEIGVKVLKTKTEMDIMGHRFFLSHGDDVGKQAFGYRFMRWIFYNRFLQWLYAGIHPRWTFVFASGISTKNRTSRHKKIETEKVQRSMAESLSNLRAFTEEHSQSHPNIEHYVYGHLHVALNETVNAGATMTMLGDWIDKFTYAKFDGTTITLEKFENF